MSTDIKLKYENSFYYELVNHPVDNFVLELTDLTGLDRFVNYLWIVISSCQDLQIAHNVFVARSKSTGFVRVVVWPRCSVFETKNLSTIDSEPSFYVAVAELAGMMVVVNEDVACDWPQPFFYNTQSTKGPNLKSGMNNFVRILLNISTKKMPCIAARIS
ncbi:hypothetical protein Smp_144250 [Schistosoma mansoni]|uniref:hypothetical protein n=1 Tax=Schistosoma mansoni TaxID=6183 RepID=UPI0001A631C9|nr:hypothetical protein Smp_144250 [Schistosoma mansoni]|eukprot:XP_018649442.1 hypothetical protein Smp_144250 [Schistosoma mansoni]